MLDIVKQQFDDWRSQRGTVGSFPEKLWRAAIDLLAHYSAKEITRELKITKAQLEDRKQRYQLTPISNNPFVDLEVTNDTVSHRIDDVKVTPQLPPRIPTSSIELRKPDGITLTIHELQQAEIQALITTFME
jgi:hypothetical protein